MPKFFNLTLPQKGFTLIEAAMVMIIMGFLLSGLIMPLSIQLDSRNYSESRKALGEIKEALMGFALSNSAIDTRPYLPCPDTDGDGRENRAGNACTSQVGGLPAQDLGLQNIDAWNNVYTYSVAPQFSNNATGFTLASPGNINVLNAAGGANVVTNVPAVVFSRGKNGATAATSADEVENTDADNVFVSREFTPTFDDTVVWISPSVLFNRMVTAGRLP
ncbi:MAG: type II secretion system protein [Methylophilus sp.]|nr:type II secretion system protein [Methylophilus sp.]